MENFANTSSRKRKLSATNKNESKQCKFCPLHCSPHQIEDQSCYPLHCAVEYNSEEIVKHLIEQGADINARNRDGEYTLAVAVRLRLTNLVRLLLAKGADVNMPIVDPSMDYLRTTCLHYAVVEPAPAGLVELLLQKGAYVNAIDFRKRTPLHVAAMSGYSSNTTALLNSGAHVHVKAMDDFGKTPLHLAATAECVRNIALLIDHGSDVNCKIGSTAKHYNCSNITGQTPLHLATKSAKVDNIITLLDYNADVNAVDEQGNTAFATAFEVDWYDEGEEARDVLFEYIIMLKFFNRHVSDYNMKYLNDDKIPNYDAKLVALHTELEKLRDSTFPENGLPLYEFLSRPVFKAATCLRNENVRDIVINTNYDNLFPVYSKFINCRIENSMRLFKLVTTAEEIVFKTINTALPSLCTAKILDHFSIRDLKRITDINDIYISIE